MKKIRIIVSNPFVVTFMSSLILLTTSCTKKHLHPSSVSSKYADYSGVDILNGLFFFQNQLSDDISYLRDIRSDISDLVQDDNLNLSPDGNGALTEENFDMHMSKMSDITVSYISEKYPDFFVEFEQVMKSGNFYAMEKSLNLATQLIDQSLLSSEKYRHASVINRTLDKNPGLKDEILSLDLFDSEDRKKFELLLNSSDEIDISSSVNSGIVVAVAVAVVAVVAVAVAAVVATVVTKVTVWDKKNKGFKGEKTSEGLMDKEIYIAEISKHLSVSAEMN